jgi:hypothetical protein
MTHNTIVLEYGQFGLKRTIFMNMKEHPHAVKPSRTGHSIDIGKVTRWSSIRGILPGFLNTPVANSDQLHVVERFLSDPNMALTRSYTAEDAVPEG